MFLIYLSHKFYPFFNLHTLSYCQTFKQNIDAFSTNLGNLAFKNDYLSDEINLLLDRPFP